MGATGIFVAAAAVGASQTRQQTELPAVATVVSTPAPVVSAVGTPGARPRPRQTPAVRPERSLAGTIRNVQTDSLDIVGVGGREWHIEPVPGALIRLNGKTAKLDSLQPGDGVVILGQAQSGPGLRFLAHAITAKSK